jgi:hypothetical protein
LAERGGAHVDHVAYTKNAKRYSNAVVEAFSWFFSVCTGFMTPIISQTREMAIPIGLVTPSPIRVVVVRVQALVVRVQAVLAAPLASSTILTFSLSSSASRLSRRSEAKADKEGWLSG